MDVADDGAARVGAILEQLSTRFELVIEAISGIGSRLDTLRSEMADQFAEVGKQIRFLSEQIGQNRNSIGGLRNDLSAEVVRLGETLGATRVEFRHQLADAQSTLGGEIAARAEATNAAVRAQLGELTAQTHDQIGREMAAATRSLPDETAERVSHRAEPAARQLATELKQVNKVLSTLSRKFERLDDRTTVQVKDHDQRLRKLERRARG
jgi:hypothetical protein